MKYLVTISGPRIIYKDTQTSFFIIALFKFIYYKAIASKFDTITLEGTK